MLNEDGPLRIDLPRDREGSFEPVLIRRHDRRFTDFDDKIVAMHARCTTVRAIARFLAEQCGTELAPDFISPVTLRFSLCGCFGRAVGVTRCQAASCHLRLLAASVSTRRRREVDSPGVSLAGQRQLSGSAMNWQSRPVPAVGERQVPGSPLSRANRASLVRP